MAKSREIPAQPPVNESETDESESEAEAKPEAPTATNLQKPADSSSSSEESGSESDSADSSSESDSDSEPDAPPTNPSSSAKAAPSSPTTTTGMKRLATPSLTQGAETKRLKKASATEQGKNLFGRVFAPEDEVLLLQELLKRYPSPQMDDLYEAVKSKLSVQVTKTQVKDKIRSLKTNFFKKKGKGANKRSSSSNVEENGEDKLKMMVFQLSETLWGNEEGPKSKVNKNKGPTRIALRLEEAMGKDEKKKDAIYDASNGISIDEWIYGEGTRRLPKEARSELEKQWKKMRKEEAQLLLEKLELSLKHAKMVYDAMSS